jgi:hypothetical protein
MPDSLPPSGWGPAPFDERDLDAVLAGETTDVPLALRPVAEALAALRAGATPAELCGETNAMAEFRALGLRYGHAAHPAGLAQTLLLETLPADTARPRSARRQARRPASGRTGALMALAAAAAVVVAVVFTGNLPGPIERLAHMAHLPTATPSAAGSAGHSAPPKVEATSATVEPTSHPADTHSAATAQPGASSACRTFYSYFTHLVPPAESSAEKSQWEQLTKLAGSQDPRRVYQYCAQYVSQLFPHGIPEMGQFPAGTGNTGPGSTGPGNQDGGPQGQQNAGVGGEQNDSGNDQGAAYSR